MDFGALGNLKIMCSNAELTRKESHNIVFCAFQYNVLCVQNVIS